MSNAAEDHEQQALREVVAQVVEKEIETARAEAADGGFSPTLWRHLDEAGFTLVGVAEQAGGSGGSFGDLALILTEIGHHAAPVPLAEHHVAAVALAEAGIELPPGPLTAAELTEHRLEVFADGDGWRAIGTVREVPWAAKATEVVVVGHVGEVPVLGRLPVTGDNLVTVPNIAGEPTGDVTADFVLRPAQIDLARLHDRLMVARSLMLVGAMRHVLTMTVQYASERVQFGRPINAFQAVGQQIAALAGAVEQADAAALTAIEVLASDGDPAMAALAAKICTGESAGTAAAIAHQVHGALGVTEEHGLHHLTRRLMAWRDQGGSAERAALDFGRRLIAAGPGSLWDLLTRTARQ